MKMHIAVTGANGLVGRRLVGDLIARGHQVRALVRYPDAALSHQPIEVIATGPIEAIQDWRLYLTGIDAVVHLAARAHVPERDMHDAALFRTVNTTATLTLAKSAAKRKVPHFIYLSSIGVHGDETLPGLPFKAASPFNPQNNYTRSKAEAEAGLRALHGGEMGITILRPPLIYGEGARGNFRKLCDLVRRAPFLPFSAIDNRRSLIATENLSAAICAVLEKQGSAFASYVLSDGRDFSLPELVRLIARAHGKACPLLPLPRQALLLLAGLFGKRPQMLRLTQSLQVDAKEFCEAFSWRPAVGAEAALLRAAAARHG